MIAKEHPADAAAIASELCALTYGLEILKENIEDLNSNTTRFMILSKNPSNEAGNKCSAVFSTLHKSGELFNVLKFFYDAKVNLTRIESMPITKDPGKFAFLVDFEGSASDPKISGLLEKLKAEAAMFKLLGCFKAK